MTTSALAMAGRSAPRSVWFALGLLFFINFLNFFDRTMPAALLEPIRSEFDLDDTQLGLLGAAFTLLYALAGIPIGRLSDRFQRTRILAVGVFAWSLSTAASGLAGSFTGFLLARLFVGVGEASCAPAANSMIADMFPSEKRARAIGIFMLGLPLGNLACFALVGPIARDHGWRMPFLLAALPGVLLALLVLLVAEPTRESQESAHAAVTRPLDRPFRRILSVPTVWWIILSGAAVNFAAYAMNTFLPALLTRRHGLDLAQAGGVSAIVLGLSGLIGLTLGGWAADRLHQLFARGRLMLGATALLTAAPLLWLGLRQPVGQLGLLTGLLAGGWLLYFAYYVTVYASLQDVVEPGLRATTMAIYFFFQYVLGGGLGTAVTGALSDRFARAAMERAGAVEMSDAFRAESLASALQLVVPLGIAVTGLALWLAARTYVRDAARVRSGTVPARPAARSAAA